MKAVVCDRYGPPEVLQIRDVERPMPGEGEVLVRVRAAAVTRTDQGYRAAHPFLIRLFSGLRRPRRRILGSEFAGEVAAVGPGVAAFAPGDRVFGSTGSRLGAHAEYVCVPQTARMAHLPAGTSFAEGAAVCEGALYALSTLRAAGLREGQRILVYGASGAIGTASVQLARSFGAHVTAVCSTRNVVVVRSLGPDRVIDYTQEDFTRITRTGETYDVIHDAVGKHSFRRCRRALAPGGVYVINDLGFLWQVPLLVLLTSRLPAGSRRVVFPQGRVSQQDVVFLKELIEAGSYRAVVDRAYPMAQVVEAARHVATGRKTGNVVITLD